MNKYQEALEYFLLWINPSEQEFDYDNYLKHRKALKELVDKEKPMKVFTNTRFDEESKVYLSFQYCERCNNIVGRFQPRCAECGQMLDWRNNDE